MTHDQTPFDDSMDHAEFERDQALWRQAAEDSAVPADDLVDDASRLNDLAALLDGHLDDGDRASLEQWLASDADRAAMLDAKPAESGEVRPLVLERARSLVSSSAPVVEVHGWTTTRVMRWVGSAAASIAVGVLGYTMGTTAPATTEAVTDDGVLIVQSANVEMVTAMSFGALESSELESDEYDASMSDLFAFDDMEVLN